MSNKTQNPDGSIQITSDGWSIVFAAQTVTISDPHGQRKRTVLCGDPHVCTDGVPVQDFPSPTCSFVLTDGTLLVVDAPAANQPLNDLHVFTTDGKLYSLGASQVFDDVIGTVFVQQSDGQFFAAVSRDIGPPPNIVRNEFATA